MKKYNPDYTTQKLPFDTEHLRKGIRDFLDTIIDDAELGPMKIGNYKYGVYAFFDYDEEPIYVGQTNENIRTRIRRHLTNQRTDAVAMNVLDPFEVYIIKVWPLPQFQNYTSKQDKKRAQPYLDALEHEIFQLCVNQSKFKAILNEKEPNKTESVNIPSFYQGRIVSKEVYELRSHPDIRVARRALTLSRLAQVISERQVQPGLRNTLLTQAKRLAWLAEQRYEACKKEDSNDENSNGEDSNQDA